MALGHFGVGLGVLLFAFDLLCGLSSMFQCSVISVIRSMFCQVKTCPM